MITIIYQKFNLNNSEKVIRDFYLTCCVRKKFKFIKKFFRFYSYVFLDKKKNEINFSRDILEKNHYFTIKMILSS